MIDTRTEWVRKIDRIARPVLAAMAKGELRQTMPVEHHPVSKDRADYTHLEAMGRTLCGIAPWLELSPTDMQDEERAVHTSLRKLAGDAIASGVDPKSPDFCNFSKGQQPIVDAAFLAHAAIRAPQFFHALPRQTQQHLIDALRMTRTRKPAFCNWLLFSAIIEAALFSLTGECDLMRIDYAVRQHEQWYKGDGVYGDGPNYHADYYNSFVIQPMLIDVLRTVGHLDEAWKTMLATVIARGQRYAEIQERSVAPDGSFPAIGRSIAYRCGAFQHLAQMALQHALPETIPPAQSRAALTAVIRRTIDAPGTFDNGGWLTIGLCGHQPSTGENYISTGSLYLCSAAFLPLGLAGTDPFWKDDDVNYTGQLIWSGKDVKADHHG